MLLVGEVSHYHAGEDLDSHCQDQWVLMLLLKESFIGVLGTLIDLSFVNLLERIIESELCFSW